MAHPRVQCQDRGGYSRGYACFLICIILFPLKFITDIWPQQGMEWVVNQINEVQGGQSNADGA